MNHSQSTAKLVEALSKAQKVFKPAIKNAVNPFFKSKYAPLENIWDSCREGLSANGLAVIQGTGIDEQGGFLYLETLLAHTSGEWISSICPIRPVKDDPQGLGSAVTYARRYGLAAMVGVVTQGEDDDANAASGHEQPETPKAPAQIKAASQVTPQVEKPLPQTGVSTTSVDKPETVAEMDRKGWERLLYGTAILNGMVDGKDDKDRPKVDFKALGHWLKETAGMKTGYVKDLSVDEIKLALDKMREMYAEGIKAKIDEQETAGTFDDTAKKLFTNF